MLDSHGGNIVINMDSDGQKDQLKSCVGMKLTLTKQPLTLGREACKAVVGNTYEVVGVNYGRLIILLPDGTTEPISSRNFKQEEKAP